MIKYYTLFCKILKYLLTALIVSSVNISYSQDAILSQFFSSPIFLNPAFAGTSEGYRLVLNYRNHPLNEASNFSFINVSGDAFIPELYGAIGLMVNSDYQGGMTWKNQIAATYAYHLQVSRDWHINFGAQAGYLRRDLFWGNLEFADPSQPPPENHWKHTADFATGVLAYSDFIYGGFAAHHLTRPKESWFGEERLPIKYTAHIGFNIEPRKNRRANTLRYDYFISPNIIFQSQGRFQRINYGLYAGIASVMAGVWFRQDLKNHNAIVFLIGFTQQNLRFGYSYDYSLSGFTNRTHGVHEISLAFDLIREDQKMRKKIFDGIKF
ncbi:MAG: PorP/SprF family type IX secretion system membrane protein [Bacteroidales bacterium]